MTHRSPAQPSSASVPQLADLREFTRRPMGEALSVAGSPGGRSASSMVTDQRFPCPARPWCSSELVAWQQAVELLEEALDHYDTKVLAVLDHQEAAIGRHVVALVAG